jgi:hypothetical protein
MLCDGRPLITILHRVTSVPDFGHVHLYILSLFTAKTGSYKHGTCGAQGADAFFNILTSVALQLYITKYRNIKYIFFNI